MPRGQTSEVGTERWSPNGYLYRRLDTHWELVHRLIAEEKLGRKLSENEYATFADGDRKNLDPDNIVIRVRGRSSLRRRLAQVQERIRELQATEEELLGRIMRQEEL